MTFHAVTKITYPMFVLKAGAGKPLPFHNIVKNYISYVCPKGRGWKAPTLSQHS